MPDYIVKQHIDDFLKSDNLQGAKDTLGVPEAENTSSVLEKIQGEAALPTKIGMEYMPPIMEFDYILPGEVINSALPLGSISRVGETLKMHDGVLPSGYKLAYEPYSAKISGFKYALPYGVPGSDSKIAASMVWGYLGNITIPGRYFRNGNKLNIKFNHHVKCKVALSTVQRNFILAPISWWSASDFYWGPGVTTVFTNPSPTNLIKWRLGPDGTTDAVSTMTRTHNINIDNDGSTFDNSEVGTYQYGYNNTTNTEWNDSTINGQGNRANVKAGDDFTFALLFNHSSNVSDTREIWYDLELTIS